MTCDYCGKRIRPESGCYYKWWLNRTRMICRCHRCTMDRTQAVLAAEKLWERRHLKPAKKRRKRKAGEE